LGRFKINDIDNCKTVKIRDLPIYIYNWLKLEASKNKTTISKVITRLVHDATASGSKKSIS
jgi:macrodomain Ter protein organizer (MatP/YcbG family)